MAVGHAYGNINADGRASVVIGDYQSTTTIHLGQPRQNITTILLESLTFERWDARVRNVVPALAQTCEWVFDHPCFRAWLDPDQISQHGGFLWLKGKPGSGKSTVMKKVLEWAQRDRSDYTILSYFFNARSPRELEKSSLGLYRSLLHQLLSRCPDATTVFTQKFSNKVREEKVVEEWTVGELQSFWIGLVANQKLPPCFMFIDALDEGSEDDVRNMVDFIVDLVGASQQNKNSILVFLSSRYYPSITIENSLSVLMEEQGGHKDDIRLYVSKKLKGGATDGMHALRELVFTGSQDVFLWVVMAVSILNKWYDQGNSASIRIEKLQKVPVDLYDVFEQILFGDTYEPQDMQECIFLFQWVLFSLRPLRPRELSTAVQISTQVFTHEDIFAEAAKDDGDQSTGTDMVKRRLIHLSRGLIELTTTSSEPVAQLIHETVRDFLLGQSRATQADQKSTIQYEFATHLDARACHCAIAKTCLLRLMAVASGVTSFQERGCFTSYAARYWWQHVEAAGGDADEEVLQLATKLCLTQSALHTWLQHYRIDEPYPDERYYPYLDSNMIAGPLYYAALTGYKKLFEAILEQDVDVDAQGGRYSNALQAASAQGHEEVVQMLLDRGADVNTQGGDYGNALVAASSRGHERVVQMLVQKGANVNAQVDYHGNALFAAATMGHEKTVQILLEKGANVEAQGIFYELLSEVSGNVLQTAAYGGHQRVVQTLLDKGADVNVHRGDYGNALQVASYQGHEIVAQMLLKNGADVNAQGGRYNNALQAASAAGHEKVVQMLLDKGADVNAQGGGSHCNALQEASVRGCEKVVQILLDKGADVNAQGGEFSNALSAASWQGHEPVVRMLLKNGADVNAQGGNYGNALVAASSKGHENVVRILLGNGADINTPEAHRGNALQTASAGGHERVVRLLLDMDADVNAPGGRFGNALQEASSRGHKRLVQMLLEKGADTNARSCYYDRTKRAFVETTALQAASAHGYEDIVQLLLFAGASVLRTE